MKIAAFCLALQKPSCENEKSKVGKGEEVSAQQSRVDVKGRYGTCNFYNHK